ncbi:MAG: alkaline phosphatase family protein [Saprospiraceae bacterium]
MTRFFLLTLFVLTGSTCIWGQSFEKKERPKLIVGVVTDQMRYDYLYRFWDRYSEGGIKKLIRRGFSCENAHFNYSPTYTGPGHAAIYTGAVPAVNGIVGNDWWDPEWAGKRYVTTDKQVQCVGCGAANQDVGKHSPASLITTTITDELRLSDNFRSKVVSVCMKDRGAILPAGRLANGCYWFDDNSGNWITSSFYQKDGELPAWVNRFNDLKLVEKYLSGTWEPLAPARESFTNFSNYYTDKKSSVFGGRSFPYDLADMKKQHGYKVIRNIPAGNTLTLDFALEAIKGYQLGQGPDTDFLCVSFSPTDHCGHSVGIHAAEIEDMYLRFDLEIERLINFLEKNIGEGQFLLFLTGDHGACETPQHMKSLGFPHGAISEATLQEKLNSLAKDSLNCQQPIVKFIGNQQIWLDEPAIRAGHVAMAEAIDFVARQLRREKGVYEVYRVSDLQRISDGYPFMPLIKRGINPKRCGHLFFQLEPGWHDGQDYLGGGGTTHGSTYPYDTHVPLLWYGWRIPSGETHERVEITDVAPTLSAMLRIGLPSGCSGKPIAPLLQSMQKK